MSWLPTVEPVSIDFSVSPFHAPAVVLIGPPGVGKSTIGRLLAEKLSCPLIDTDLIIEQHVAKSIAQIFQDDGEPTFRALEASLLASLCAAKIEEEYQGPAHTFGVVIATGAGLPVNPGNLERLQSLGHLVCLVAPVEVLAHRLSGAKDRPLLAPRSVDQSAQSSNSQLRSRAREQEQAALLIRLEAIVQARKPIYDRAKYVIETNLRSSQQVVELIVDLVARSS
jgi:shikimate kinase